MKAMAKNCIYILQQARRVQSASDGYISNCPRLCI